MADPIDRASTEDEPTRNDGSISDRLITKATAIGRGALDKSESIIKATEAGAHRGLNRVQNRYGENYRQILDGNPVIVSTLEKSPLLVDNRDLLSTVLNVQWTSLLLWSAAAGSAFSQQRPIAKITGGAFHYGPGHIARWSEVNSFMDSAAGSGHRLKFGHSIEFLPQIVERFGPEGVPAFGAHLLQDFMSTDGLPIVPDAWNVKLALSASLGLSPKLATSLVSLNFALLVSIVMVGKVWQSIDQQRRLRRYLRTAEEAYASNDFEASAANYLEALRIERKAELLLALGQVYLRQRAHRMKAFEVFKEATSSLATRLDRTFSLGGADISLRGFAALQALSAADVLAGIHPEFWQDHVQSLVSAAVSSFVTCAKMLEQEVHRPQSALFHPKLISAALNYYLASNAACRYPFADARQELVTDNLKSSLRCLAQARQREPDIETKITDIGELWALTLLPPDEADLVLNTY